MLRNSFHNILSKMSREPNCGLRLLNLGFNPFMHNVVKWPFYNMHERVNHAKISRSFNFSKLTRKALN